MAKEILILAGGGGHTAYAYALAQALCDRASLSFLVPEGDALSEKRLSKFGAVDHLVKARGPTTPAHKFVVGLTRAFATSSNKVPRRISAVVSSGSNFCVPPAFTAWLKGIPVINIESSVRFTKASKTALVLQPISTLTALHWEEQKRLLGNGIVVGPLLPKPEVEAWNGDYTLVTGGTMGHKRLFDAISEINLDNVVLQTGRVDPGPYRKEHPNWKIVPFSSRFHELIAGAKLVVTHFGATALEALTYRKPIVMVLNPEWKRTVGKPDAEILAEKINAVFIWDLSLRGLLSAMEEAESRKTPTLLDGARKLAEMILDV